MTELPVLQTSTIYGAGSPHPQWDVALTAVYYVYLVIISLLMIVSTHAYVMVALRMRLRRRQKDEPGTVSDDDLPSVSVQVPVYNEGPLAVQAVDAAAGIDYRSDRLEIIVLDGSTDDTPALLRPLIERLRRRGVKIVHHRRDNSVGYKAGALADGLRLTEAELIAVFDADFLPGRGFLRGVVHHFTDPRVGCVQTRWGHRNAGGSILTGTQTIHLDAYYGTEMPVRSEYGFCTLFTGTCGVWRKRAVEDAGGWTWDTLVEDMDISIRAQLRGWRVVFDGGVVTLGELPERISSYLRQQHRWVMGHTQVFRKHVGNVLGSGWSLVKKAEAMILLLRWTAYPLLLAMALLMMPALIINPELRQMSYLESALGTLLFIAASGGAMIFYASGQVYLHPRTWWRRVLYLPALVSLTVAMAPNAVIGIVQAFAGRNEPFRKTPRVGEGPPRLVLSELCLVAINAVAGLYLLGASAYTFVRALRIEAWDFLITAVALLAFSIGMLCAAASGASAAVRSLTARVRRRPAPASV